MTIGELNTMYASSEDSGVSVHLNKLILAFIIVTKSLVLPQMALSVLFKPAAKTSRACSQDSGDSAHLQRLD